MLQMRPTDMHRASRHRGPDGTAIATTRLCSHPGRDAQREPELSLKALFGNQDDDVEIAAFHPVKQLIATAARDYYVRVYDFTGNLVARLSGHTADVVWVDWTEDGEKLVSLSDDGEMRRWPWTDEQLFEDIRPGSEEQRDNAVVTFDDALNGANERGAIVAVRHAQMTRVKAHDAGVKRLAIHPSKALLVSVSYDGALGVWDIASQIPKKISMRTFGSPARCDDDR
ncbi:hypothetical protein BST20_17745 [Mycobacterium branderi]|nr:hypothetical protein BST20_17745 [Mycobacterium branderi]